MTMSRTRPSTRLNMAPEPIRAVLRAMLCRAVFSCGMGALEPEFINRVRLDESVDFEHEIC